MMKVKKLSGKVQDAQQIPTLFDHENIMYYPINIVNWKEYHVWRGNRHLPQKEQTAFSNKYNLYFSHLPLFLRQERNTT